MPSSSGTEPPDRLVPVPRATNGTPAPWHSRTVLDDLGLRFGEDHRARPGAKRGQAVALVRRQRGRAGQQPVGRVDPRKVRQQIGHDARSL